MKVRTNNPESGLALFFAIFTLLLLTAIGASLILMSGTETSINSNYRQEQIAYFAAKAGIEEARARMMAADPNTINTGANPLLNSATAAAPAAGNGMINYIVNNGSAANSVQPWTSTNTYADDELCHDGYGTTFGTATAPDVRCTAVTIAAGTYTPYNSRLPYSGTANAVPYKWVRIAPKVNGSVGYLTGTGSVASTQSYSVNSNSTATVDGIKANINASTLICWDGTEEVPLVAANCNAVQNASGAAMTNVYLLTSLGVSPSGARRVVQAEVALTPTPPFIYGMYATSTACPALTFNGNNASTNSYTTANGGTYSGTETNTGGDIGSNGGVDIGNGNIGGIVGVLAPPPAGNGTCTTPLAEGPNGTTAAGSSVSCPSGNSAQCYLPLPYTFPTPPAPNPLPPNTSYSPPSCGGKGKSGQCMVPGTYGNISITGTLTLAPGTYNLNSLSMTGNAAIVVSPPGAVTLNMGGTGQSTVLAIAGNGITDDTIPNDFIINYAGTDGISITGNGTETAILNAPNAPLTQKGNGNWYGSILASTISLGGNAFFHYDKNAALAPNNNGYYTMISYREVPY